MCRFCWLISAVLLVALSGLGYIALVRGNTVASDDGRTAIIMTSDERDLVLAEMRGFLEAVQAITESVAENDMAGAARNARKVGSGAAEGVPLALMAKLPLEFKTLGLSTHSAFDNVALEAEGIGSDTEVLKQISTLMLNCTGCHAGYKLVAETGPSH